jgi:RNA polymerase sigma factor (sigma-70 family)
MRETVAYLTHALGRAAAAVPDADLLVRFARHRDEAAFAEIVRRHGPLVYRECRRAAGPDSADDAFQATFLILARRSDRLAHPDRLAGWLFGVATRVARRARGQLARRRMRERPVANLPDAAAPAAEPADWQAVVHEELARLPPDYRAAVVLCDLEGHPRREAARLLGVPDGTLSNRLARARALLGRRLLRRGLGPAGLAGLAVVGAPPELLAATVELAVGGTIPPRVLVLASGGGLRMTLIRAGVLTVVGIAVALTLAPAAAPPQAPAAAAPAGPPPDPTPVDGLSVRDMALSPDGKLLAVCEWNIKVNTPVTLGAISFFDPATLKLTRRLTGPDEVGGWLRFAPDGKAAYVNAAYRLGPEKATIRRVDVASWKALGQLDPAAGFPANFAVSPDGKTLAVYLEDARFVRGQPHPKNVGTRVAIFDAVTFAHVRDLRADVRLNSTFAYAPDGKAIGVAYNATEAGKAVAGVVEFDPETGKELHRCSYKARDEVGTPFISQIVYAPGGKRAVLVGGTVIPTSPNSSRSVGTVHYWDRGDPRVHITWVEGESGAFTAGLFSADGRRFFLGNWGPTQRTGRLGKERAFWHASKAQCWDTPETGWWFLDIHWSADGEKNHVNAMTLDPTGTRLLLADEAGIWVFDAATGQRRGGLIRTQWE